MYDDLFDSMYSAYEGAIDTSASKSSAEQDLAMNFSPFEKKKNAPEAPPSVKRSLIVVEKALKKNRIRLKTIIKR
jgi:hypothetical protein